MVICETLRDLARLLSFSTFLRPVDAIGRGGNGATSAFPGPPPVVTRRFLQRPRRRGR